MMPDAVYYFFKQYWVLFLRAWNHMTPNQYFGVLVFISLAGWLLMRNSSKR